VLGVQYHALLLKRGVQAHGAGGDATHIGVVGTGGDESDQAIGRDNGSHDGDVGKVRAAEKGVIENHDIASLPAHAPDDIPHAPGHRSQMHGDVRGLGHQFTAGIKNGAGEILAILDVGRQGTAFQNGAHLAAYGGQPMGKEAQFHRIHEHRSNK